MKHADERIIELAKRLVAPGGKASQVSCSECHEISDFILSLAPVHTNKMKQDTACDDGEMWKINFFNRWLERAKELGFAGIAEAIESISPTNCKKDGPLSCRLRPNSECAPWVIEEVRKLEADLAISQAARAKVGELEGLADIWDELSNAAYYDGELERRDVWRSAAQRLRNVIRQNCGCSGEIHYSCKERS
jgi:hypothetical protein